MQVKYLNSKLLPKPTIFFFCWKIFLKSFCFCFCLRWCIISCLGWPRAPELKKFSSLSLLSSLAFVAWYSSWRKEPVDLYCKVHCKLVADNSILRFCTYWLKLSTIAIQWYLWFQLKLSIYQCLLMLFIYQK